MDVLSRLDYYMLANLDWVTVLVGVVLPIISKRVQYDSLIKPIIQAKIESQALLLMSGQLKRWGAWKEIFVIKAIYYLNFSAEVLFAIPMMFLPYVKGIGGAIILLVLAAVVIIMSSSKISQSVPSDEEHSKNCVLFFRIVAMDVVALGLLFFVASLCQ